MELRLNFVSYFKVGDSSNRVTFDSVRAYWMPVLYFSQCKNYTEAFPVLFLDSNSFRTQNISVTGTLLLWSPDSIPPLMRTCALAWHPHLLFTLVAALLRIDKYFFSKLAVYPYFTVQYGSEANNADPRRFQNYSALERAVLFLPS